MRRLAAFVVGVCLSASAVARADTSTDAETEARFNFFRKTGDHARLTGRYEEAAIAYKEALKIHPHPVIRGRFGLVLVKLGHPDKAAEELHDAFEHGQGVTAQERREVGAAFDKAKAATTWVTVNVSQMGANVTCDGAPWNPNGFASFWAFAMPGEHTLRATLDGYEEAVETFTAKPGDEITISLKLVPHVKLEPISEDEPILRKKRKFPPHLGSSNIIGASDYDCKEDPSCGEPKETKPIKKKTGPRFSVNGGVVTVFGVASWNPAVGAVVGVAVKPKEFFSLGLEGRAAWLTTGVGGGQISAMTAGGILSACGHAKWFFGCGIGSLGALNIKFSPESYTGKSSNHLIVGGGGRVGALFHASESFVLLGSIDILKLSSGTKVAVGNQIVADIPPIMIGGQISGGWEF